MALPCRQPLTTWQVGLGEVDVVEVGDGKLRVSLSLGALVTSAPLTGKLVDGNDDGAMAEKD